jgi:hypothetical protein
MSQGGCDSSTPKYLVQAPSADLIEEPPRRRCRVDGNGTVHFRPGGRFVLADPDPRMSANEPSSGWGVPRRGEAEYRRWLEDAGFTEMTVRFVGSALLMAARKPPASIAEGSIRSDERERVPSTATA